MTSEKIKLKVNERYITPLGRPLADDSIIAKYKKLAQKYGGATVTGRSNVKGPETQELPKTGKTDSEKLGYDAAVAPAHYLKYEIEPFEFIIRNKLPFDIGNVVKYVLRYDDKNGIEDLRKAMRNIELRIFYLQGRKNWNKIKSRVDEYSDVRSHNEQAPSKDV